MKIKAPTNRPKTQREINTSTKTRATQRRTAPQRTGGKKVQKQDNTKIFIGVGVGAFFLLFIIIAAASGGNSDRVDNNDSASSSSKKQQFNLPIDIRRQIYADYLARDNKIEDEAQSKINGDRSAGADIRTEADRLKIAMRVDLREKWSKKYPGVNSSFIKRVISEGIDNGWR